jgi:hypothetical protein
MEKRSPLYYIGQYLLILLVAFSLSAGTLAINNFITHNEKVSFFTELGVFFLGALAFVASYLVGAFVIPGPTQKSWGLISVGIIWGVFLIVISLMVVLKFMQPIYPFLSAIQNYSLSGLILAQTSTRLRSAVKP